MSGANVLHSEESLASGQEDLQAPPNTNSPLQRPLQSHPIRDETIL